MTVSVLCCLYAGRRIALIIYISLRIWTENAFKLHLIQPDILAGSLRDFVPMRKITVAPRWRFEWAR